LGTGDSNIRFTPVAVFNTGILAGVNIRSFSKGGFNSCAISDVGQAYCVGDNSSNALGINNALAYSYSALPVDTSGLLNNIHLTNLSTGSYYTCALDEHGDTYCWGQSYSNGSIIVIKKNLTIP
jgi:alpha-tubulin suppressor-like RCC1 family protein